MISDFCFQTMVDAGMFVPYFYLLSVLDIVLFIYLHCFPHYHPFALHICHTISPVSFLCISYILSYA